MHPVSQAQQALLEEWREMLRDRLADGLVADSETAHLGLMRHARVAGSLDIISQLQGLDYAGLVSGMES